jgi:hypothetical protein
VKTAGSVIDAPDQSPDDKFFVQALEHSELAENIDSLQLIVERTKKECWIRNLHPGEVLLWSSQPRKVCFLSRRMLWRSHLVSCGGGFAALFWNFGVLGRHGAPFFFSSLGHS